MSYKLTAEDVHIIRQVKHFVEDGASPKLWREFDALLERLKMAGV